jgi:hypothetical protein
MTAPDASADRNQRPSEAALIASEVRHVVIEGDDILAARVDAGDIYLPLRSMCDALGVSYQGQVARIRRDEVLADGLHTLRVATGGGVQSVQALHLECVPLWLAGLEPGRVKEEIRPRLRVYKRWVRQKVWEVFATELDLPQTSSPAAADPTALSLQQVAELGRALTAMAEQQLVFQQEQTQVRSILADHEQRLDAQEGRLDRAAQVMGETIRQVHALKRRLDPGNVITDEQAAELQETIKAIAEELTRQSAGTGQQKNYYASLFSELHKRFRVSTYKNLTIEKYERAMAWLRDYDEALGRSLPPPLEGPG